MFFLKKTFHLLQQPRATAKGIYVPDAKGRVGTPQVGLDATGSIDLQAMLSSIPKREVATAKVILIQNQSFLLIKSTLIIIT